MIWRRKAPTDCPSRDDLAASLMAGSEEYRDHRNHCDDCSQSWTNLQYLSADIQATLSSVDTGERGDAASCPDVTVWAAFADRHVTHQVAAALVEHLAACGDCASLWEFLVGHVRDEDRGLDALTSGGGPAEPEGADEPGTFRLLLAAAGLAALLLYVALPPPRVEPGGGDRWRGPEPRLESESRSTGERAAPSVHWSHWPGADSYRLRVWSLEGVLLVDQSLEPASDGWELNTDAIESETIYWLVEAIKGGRVVAAGEIGVLALPSPRARDPEDPK